MLRIVIDGILTAIIIIAALTIVSDVQRRAHTLRLRDEEVRVRAVVDKVLLERGIITYNHSHGSPER